MDKKQALKEGKRPLTSKRQLSEAIHWDDVFSSNLALDPELIAELELKGLVPRFVDAKRMAEMNGYNDKGWQVYKRDKKISDTIEPLDFKYGNDPSGVVRRGSLVLAVKTKEKAERHRAFLNQRASQAKVLNEQQADELRQFARRSGLNAEIHEGYDEEGDKL